MSNNDLHYCKYIGRDYRLRNFTNYPGRQSGVCSLPIANRFYEGISSVS
jgi:hypothetical protein